MSSEAHWLRRTTCTCGSRFILALGGLLFFLACPLPGSAQVESDPGRASDAPPEELHLSLLDAIAEGVKSNLDVEIERHAPLIASETRIQALGAYDPTWFSDFGYSSDETPIASSLQNSNVLAERRVGGGLGLRGLFPRIGGDWEIGYVGESLETNSSIQSLSPNYDASLQANASLPLLKGFMWNEPWLEIRLSTLREVSALDEFRSQLLRVVREIEINYWLLVAAGESLRVADKSLDTARALKDQTQAQYEVGTLSKVEVTEAEAGVAEREVNRITAENAYWNAQDVLVDTVFGTRLTPLSQVRIVPSDEPEVVDYPISHELIAARAFENRPELSIARRDVEQRKLEYKFARNQRLPQLDVVGTLGYAGLAGQENSSRLIIPRDEDGDGNPDPPQPLRIDRDYSDTDDDFFSSSGAKNWSLTANFSIPIGNVQARSGARSRELELRRARTSLKRTEQSIVLEARAAIRDLVSSREGIEAAERRRLAAEEQLRAERVRLEYGDSTPFDALQRERDLVEAESQKITALQLYREAIARLDAAQGTILEDRNVLIEEARALR